MWLSDTPLWQQLLILWGVAFAVIAALLWLDLRRPYDFFLLLPYPTWRIWVWWPTIAELFRMRPMLAIAVAIPIVATLGSLALCVVQLAPWLGADRSG
jgi:hypothetical protein